MADTATTKTNSSTNATTSGSGKKNPLLLLSYATIIAIWAGCQVILIPYVVNLLVLVTSILYVACHWSLTLREEEKVDGEEDETDKQDNDDDKKPATPQVETLSASDAYQFPLVGSVSLFSLYLAFKFLDKEWVNLIIGGYFCIVGCLAIVATLAPALITLIPIPTLCKNIQWKKSWTFENKILEDYILGPSPLEMEIDFQLMDIIALIPAGILCYFYFMTKHWALNNILGICFCLQGIQRFSLGTYKIGAILLIGLFFYDIFWVFGTEVMVTVAKNLDGT